jgi:hypothetical protein
MTEPAFQRQCELLIIPCDKNCARGDTRPVAGRHSQESELKYRQSLAPTRENPPETAVLEDFRPSGDLCRMREVGY